MEVMTTVVVFVSKAGRSRGLSQICSGRDGGCSLDNPPAAGDKGGYEVCGLYREAGLGDVACVSGWKDNQNVICYTFPKC